MAAALLGLCTETVSVKHINICYKLQIKLEMDYLIHKGVCFEVTFYQNGALAEISVIVEMCSRFFDLHGPN